MPNENKKAPHEGESEAVPTESRRHDFESDPEAIDMFSDMVKHYFSRLSQRPFTGGEESIPDATGHSSEE